MANNNTFYIDSKLVLLNGQPMTLPVAASDPGSAVAGDMYFNSGSGLIRVYNGAAWVALDAGGLIGLPLPQHDMVVGDSGGLSAQVDTGSAGDILGDSVNGLTIKSGVIVNSQVSSSAAIAYSKLALSNSIVNADINTAAAIAYSKLNLATSIVNGDISATAAIAYSKLALSASIVNADISASAAIAYSKLALSASIVNADIASGAAIAYSKLSLASSILASDMNSGAATSGQILTANGTGGASYQSPAFVGTVTSVAATVPSFLSISGSPITSSGTLAISYSGTALPIANGGTGATSASAAFNNLNPMTTAGDVMYEASAGVAARLGIGSSGQVLTVSGGLPVWSSPATSGTVTSVALSDASTSPIFAVSGSPVTSSGTLTLTLQTQAANVVFAGPVSGGSAQPAFRSLVVNDIPSLSSIYEINSNFAVRSYINSIALAANVSSPTTIPALTFAFATYGAVEFKYVMIEASTNSRRMGHFAVTTDGVVVGYNDHYAESSVLGNGISLSAAVSGSNIIIQFTGTNANAVTMRCEITSFVA